MQCMADEGGGGGGGQGLGGGGGGGRGHQENCFMAFNYLKT